MPLKGIPRLISPELLSILARMGHGDELLIADANFPSHSQGVREIVHCDGCSSTDVLEAVLELLPLDSFVKYQASVMKRVDSEEDAPIIADFQRILDEAYAKDGATDPVQLERVERFAFYTRAKSTFAICVTGESRLYGNIIIKKGVVGEDGATVINASGVATKGDTSKRIKITKKSSSRAPPTTTEKNGDVNGSQSGTTKRRRPPTKPKRELQSGAEPIALANGRPRRGARQHNADETQSTASTKIVEASSMVSKSHSERVHHTDSEEDDDEEGDDNDATITYFSAAAFQQQTMSRRKEQEEEKGKRTRRSLNSLSAQQQFELALKRSLTENSASPSKEEAQPQE